LRNDFFLIDEVLVARLRFYMGKTTTKQNEEAGLFHAGLLTLKIA
jgi:hypothetical protein